MVIRKLLIGCLAAAAVAGAVAAQPALTPAAAAAGCEEVLREARKAGLAVGFAAVQAEGGAEVCRSLSDRPMIPASNMKLVAAGAALLGLGAEHAIFTDLVAHGSQAGDVLQGHLRLRGEGDPTLKSPETPAFLARRVAEAGIRRVAGDLLVDDRLFDREFQGPAWPKDAPTEEHMAGAAALSLDHGTVAVTVSAGPRPGDPATVKIVPEGAGVRCLSKLTTTADRGEHLISVVRPPAENVLTVSGRVAAGTRAQEVSVAIHDPAMVFGHALAAALRHAGVTVDGQVRRPDGDEKASGGRLLVRIETKLGDIVPVMLKASQNHRAEMVWKHLGACLGGAGSFAGGAEAVRKVLAARDIALDGAVLADGSGLSRDNRVSADQVVAILAAVWKSAGAGIFRESLPAGGEPGSTLRNRLKDLGPRVRAKTGYIRGVVALSGYVEPASGPAIAFSILTRQERPGRLGAKSVEDRIVRILARVKAGP